MLIPVDTTPLKLPDHCRPRFARALLAAVYCLGLVPAHGLTIEERLTALEERVAALAAENAALRAELQLAHAAPPAVAEAAAPDPPTAPVLDAPPARVQPAGKETLLVIGGLVQAHVETGGTPDARYAGANDRFLLRRARINAVATFAEHFTAKIEGDFGAASIAAGSGLRAQLTDGYVEWHRHPQAVVRFGQFKTPFGFEQLASDPRLPTIERALSSDRLTVSRQLGGSLSGALAGKRIAYSVGAFNGNGTNTGNNDNDDFMVAGRFGGTLLQGSTSGLPFKWTVAANAFRSDDSGAFSGRREGLGFDTQLALGPAELRAEWLRNRRTGSTRATAQGWSLLALWDFTGQWRGVVRFDTYDADTRSGNSTTDEWTFGVDYRIRGDDLKLSLNYLLGDQPDPAGSDGRLLGRVQVVF